MYGLSESPFAAAVSLDTAGLASEAWLAESAEARATSAFAFLFLAVLDSGRAAVVDAMGVGTSEWLV